MYNKYTWDDIIINPNDPRIEVGKEYYYNSVPFAVLWEVNKDFYTSILEGVIEGSSEPFKVKSGNCYSCIIRKKEPKYVPFDLSDPKDRAKLRGAWIKNKGLSHREYQIVSISIPNKSLSLGDDVRISLNDLFDRFEFVDGSPCGKLVEAGK